MLPPRDAILGFVATFDSSNQVINVFTTNHHLLVFQVRLWGRSIIEFFETDRKAA